MHIMTGWGDNTLRLASVSVSGSTATLTVQSPESTIVFVRPYPHLGGQFSTFQKHVYYFENALEFLDQPGEWYLDESTGVLYYKPRTGEDMATATVVAPMVETVVGINGTSTVEPGRLPLVPGDDLRALDVHASEPVRLLRRAGGPVQPDGDERQQADDRPAVRRRQCHERQSHPLRAEPVHADGRDRASTSSRGRTTT